MLLTNGFYISTSNNDNCNYRKIVVIVIDYCWMIILKWSNVVMEVDYIEAVMDTSVVYGITNIWY